MTKADFLTYLQATSKANDKRLVTTCPLPVHNGSQVALSWVNTPDGNLDFRCAGGCSVSDYEAFWRTSEPANPDVDPADTEQDPAASQGEGDPSVLESEDWTSMPEEEDTAQIEGHWWGWTSTESLTLVSGDEESLKTLFMMVLAVATAGGVRICDLIDDDAPPLPADRTDLVSGPVIYISAENGRWEEMRRFCAIRRGLGLDGDLAHPFHFVNGDTLSLRLPRPGYRDYSYGMAEWVDGEDNDEVTALFELIRRVQPRMIVFDTVSHLADIPNENDNAVVRQFVKTRLLPAARENAAAVYAVMHPPARLQVRGAGPRKEVRGATAWRHAADTTLYVERAPALGQDAAIITLRKVRRGPKVTRRIGFRVTDEGDGMLVEFVPLDAPTTQPLSKLEQAVKACLDILAEAPAKGLTVGEVTAKAVEAKHTKSTVLRALDLIRGAKTWPSGPHAGRKQSLVKETGKQGTEKRLTLLPEDVA